MLMKASVCLFSPGCQKHGDSPRPFHRQLFWWHRLFRGTTSRLGVEFGGGWTVNDVTRMSWVKMAGVE